MDDLCALLLRWLFILCGWKEHEQNQDIFTMFLFAGRLTMVCGLIGALVGSVALAFCPVSVLQFAINGAGFGGAMAAIAIVATWIVVN